MTQNSDVPSGKYALFTNLLLILELMNVVEDNTYVGMHGV